MCVINPKTTECKLVVFQRRGRTLAVLLQESSMCERGSAVSGLGRYTSLLQLHSMVPCPPIRPGQMTQVRGARGWPQIGISIGQMLTQVCMYV